jgi:hypothetical protein
MKYLALVFVFVLAIGFACAADEWGDINSGSASQDGSQSGIEDGSSALPTDDSTSSDDSALQETGSDYVAPDYSGDESGGVYTDNFYIALGLGGFGLLIVIYFIYLFFKKPRNKWKS